MHRRDGIGRPSRRDRRAAASPGGRLRRAIDPRRGAGGRV